MQTYINFLAANLWCKHLGRIAWVLLLPLGLTCNLLCSAAEVEPNNSRQQANVLGLSGSGVAVTTGRINPLSDLDYFSVSVPPLAGAGTFVITMTPTSSDHGLDAKVQLLNTSGLVLAEKNSSLDGEPESLTYPSVSGNSVYFIVCRSVDLLNSGSGDYTLRVELLQPKPNLVFYKPSGWSDAMVVSKVTGSSVESAGLTTTNALFLDVAIGNGGSLPTSGRFEIDLFVDGSLTKAWFVDQAVNPGASLAVLDYPIGPLTAGSHSLKVVLDVVGSIQESDEGDNLFTKVIVVSDDDPDDQIAGSPYLGETSQTITTNAVLVSATDVNIVAFRVAVGQRITFDLNDIVGWDPYIRLFDENGLELASNDNSKGPVEGASQESFLDYTFSKSGNYFMGVSSGANRNYNPVTGKGDVAGGPTGTYKLVISPGIAGAITRQGSQNAQGVDLLRFGGVSMPIINNATTWVIIHGWNSSRAELKIHELTKAIYEARPGDQVLTLDWSQAADTGILDPLYAESAIVPVGEWAAAALVEFGFRGTNLNLVGHSFGSYVADEIAKRIPGGVHSIVTLDPAADIPGGFDPTANDEINFGRDSFFSWSFHSSSAGNEFTPTTADEAFIVESGLNTIDAHGNVVILFAYMVLHPDEIIGNLFRLSSLLSGTRGPWWPDRFTSAFLLDRPVQGYEAKITTISSGREPSSIQFVRLPTIVIARDSDNLAVAWSSAYTNVVLQSSSHVGTAASWIDVAAPIEKFGEASVVRINSSGAGRFFRLRQL